MDQQMSIFDCFPDLCLNPGDYVGRENVGIVICHIMRPSYIGKMVVVDRSTDSREWWQVGILEKYIPYEGRYRSIVYNGSAQRLLITHYPGVEIRELKRPGEKYEDRIRRKT